MPGVLHWFLRRKGSEGSPSRTGCEVPKSDSDPDCDVQRGVVRCDKPHCNARVPAAKLGLHLREAHGVQSGAIRQSELPIPKHDEFTFGSGDSVGSDAEQEEEHPIMPGLLQRMQQELDGLKEPPADEGVDEICPENDADLLPGGDPPPAGVGEEDAADDPPERPHFYAAARLHGAIVDFNLSDVAGQKLLDIVNDPEVQQAIHAGELPTSLSRLKQQGHSFCESVVGEVPGLFSHRLKLDELGMQALGFTEQIDFIPVGVERR